MGKANKVRFSMPVGALISGMRHIGGGVFEAYHFVNIDTDIAEEKTSYGKVPAILEGHIHPDHAGVSLQYQLIDEFSLTHGKRVIFQTSESCWGGE